MDTDAGAPAPAAAALFTAARGGGGDSGGGGRASALEVAPTAPAHDPRAQSRRCCTQALRRCRPSRAVSDKGCPALPLSLGTGAGTPHAGRRASQGGGWRPARGPTGLRRLPGGGKRGASRTPVSETGDRKRVMFAWACG